MSQDIVFNYKKVFAKSPLSKMDAPAEHIGTVAMALVRPPKDRDRTSSNLVTYKASFAFCNVSDQFSKEKARQLTLGRLKSNRHKNSIVFQMPSNASLKDAICQAYQLATSTTNIVACQKGSGRPIYFAPNWLINSQHRVFVPGFY